jgi:hypothetical protein
MDIRTLVKKAKKAIGEDAFKTNPNTYKTDHYTFVPGKANGFDDVKTAYPLLDCGFAIHPTDYPMGPDCGPFTKALIHARLTSNTRLLLSELDTYLESMGISRDLEGGYTDADFLRRHEVMVRDYQKILMKSAEENNIRWDI